MTNADRCGKEIAKMVRAFNLEDLERKHIKAFAFDVARLVAKQALRGGFSTWDADLTQAELEMGL